MAITCRNCGYAYNDNTAQSCAVCNTHLQTESITSITHDEELLERNFIIESESSLYHSSNDYSNNEPNRGSITPLARQIEHPANQNILEGRINHLERNEERPPTDFFSIISKILIGLLLLIPIAALFFISGILSFSFGFLGLSSLSRLFNPFVWLTSIFELLEVIVLRRMKGTDTIPVYRGMVEDGNSREYSFIFRGPMNSGNLVEGNHVRFFGHRKRGTFNVRNGTDLTVSATISSSYRNPWRAIFLILLVIYMALGSGFYFYIQRIGGLTIG